jgi:hypothetical protein
MQIFQQKIEIIGVNPYVEVPDNVLGQLFKQSGKDKGPIPVSGMINGKPFVQTVVKYQGLWRLYLNTPMRQASNTKVGDTVTVALEYNDNPPVVEMPARLVESLKENSVAKTAFEKLPPYRQKEITRYLANLKTPETLEKNLQKVMDFLEGKPVDSVVLTYQRSSKKVN